MPPIAEIRKIMKELVQRLQASNDTGKRAGSYVAGMAVAISILNVDGRRHTNNFCKNM